MKKLHYHILILLIAHIVWLPVLGQPFSMGLNPETGQGGTTDRTMEYQGVAAFENKTLREQNDTLHLDYEIRIKAGAVDRSHSMRLTLQLTDGTQYYNFPYMQVQGRVSRQLDRRWESTRNKKIKYERPYVNVVVTPDTDTVLTYLMSVPYEMWMDTAQLVLHQELIGYRVESRLMTFMLGNRVHLQPQEPYIIEPQLAFIMPERVEKRRTKQGQAFLDFQVGRSVLLPNYRRNADELSKIRDAMREVQSNSDVIIKGLFVEGYASPDGRYESNDKLSRERATALKEYMKNEFGLPEQLFKVGNVAEDWDGLRVLVDESDLVRRIEVLAVIDSDDTPDRKEQRLKAMGWPWTAMLNSMFPQLRRVEYQVDYSIKDFSVDQVKELIGKQDDMLSHLELYLAAQSYGPESPLYEDLLLERIPRYYPDDPAAMNNAAAIMISRGELLTAGRYLERAGDDPEVLNNRGVLLMLEGELEAARPVLEQAAALGCEQAVHNLGQLDLKLEDNIKMQRYNHR